MATTRMSLTIGMRRFSLVAACLAALLAPAAASADGIGFHVIKDGTTFTKRDIRSVEVRQFPSGSWGVVIRFGSEAARQIAKLTRENVGYRMQFVVGDRVISTPVIREAIAGGSIALTGNFDEAQAEKIAEQIRSGR